MGAYGSRFWEAPPEKVAEHILYGAIVGGQQKDGTYNDVVSDYATNEVATDYNAGFTAALAEIIRLKNLK